MLSRQTNAITTTTALYVGRFEFAAGDGNATKRKSRLLSASSCHSSTTGKGKGKADAGCHVQFLTMANFTSGPGRGVVFRTAACLFSPSLQSFHGSLLHFSTPTREVVRPLRDTRKKGGEARPPGHGSHHAARLYYY